MENASKALLMAGGTLIGILVISALVYMFNQLGFFDETQSHSAMSKEIAKFNREFSQYTDSDIIGTDLISLMNKIRDYNERAESYVNDNGEVVESVDYNLPMKITISGMNEFRTRYATQADIFDSDIEIGKDESGWENYSFLTHIRPFSDMEQRLGISKMKKLSSYYSEIESITVADERTKRIEELLSPASLSSLSISEAELITAIKDYKDYGEFKTAKFESNQEPDYSPQGQIQNFYFRFKR